jgi:periplasmic divalent cation tolerance protein
MVSISEIVSTYASREEAEKNLKHFLERRLVGCGHVTEVHSAYWWENKIHQENEWLLKVKTTNERAPFVLEEVKRHHSYELPYIALTSVTVTHDYRDWLSSVVNTSDI